MTLTTERQGQSPDSRVRAGRIKMAEDAKMLSRAPKWFQFLELKWLQTTGSQFPWYTSLPGFLAIAGGFICCSPWYRLATTYHESSYSETKRYEFIYKKESSYQ